MRAEDPRVKRTRKLIVDAFVQLLAEKSFHAISVQDIAEVATVNRATFYAHFEDKYALLDHLIREKFRAALAAPGLPGTAFDEGNFLLLIETVLDFLARFHGGCRPADRDMAPTIESSMQQELYAFLSDWLSGMSPAEHTRSLTPQCTASVLSWAIFGAGIDWSRHGGDGSVHERAELVRSLLTLGLAGVIAGPEE